MKSSNDLKLAAVHAPSRAASPTPNPSPSVSEPTASSVSLFRKGAGWIGAAVITALLCNKALSWASGFLLATIISTMALGQQASVLSTKTSSQVDAQVTATAETYRIAVLKGDVSTLMTLYRDDAIEMPFFGPPVRGRSAIQQFYQEQFQSPAHVTSFTFTPAETSTHGDVAYDVGTYTRIMNTPAGPTQGSGGYVVLLKRSAGQWKIAYITYTCNCPPEAGASPMVR